MGQNLFLSNHQEYVARDRIQKVGFQSPGEQDLFIQLMGDNIHQMSNYSVVEEYFDGADGSRRLLKREARVDVYTWSNLLGRFGTWAMQQSQFRGIKWVAQVHGHTSALMFNERSTIRAVPVGQGQGGMSLMHISLVNRCPNGQVYRDHDIVGPLPWMYADVTLIGGKYVLHYDNPSLPYYYWFDGVPTFNESTYMWECGATTNVFVLVPFCLEGATLAPKANGTGPTNPAQWILEALDEDLSVLASNTVLLVVPAGTRYVRYRSNNTTDAKSLEQPAIQIVTYGDEAEPLMYLDPRGLAVVVADL